MKKRQIAMVMSNLKNKVFESEMDEKTVSMFGEAYVNGKITDTMGVIQSNIHGLLSKSTHDQIVKCQLAIDGYEEILRLGCLAINHELEKIVKLKGLLNAKETKRNS